MIEPYLIAHVVRGSPAFDIAEQMPCSTCQGYPFGGYPENLDGPGCDECNSLGYWWIIPTSGHRAYPYWWIKLDDLPDLQLLFTTTDYGDVRIPPPIHPDHYAINNSFLSPPADLAKALAAAFPRPKIARR